MRPISAISSQSSRRPRCGGCRSPAFGAEARAKFARASVAFNQHSPRPTSPSREPSDASVHTVFVLTWNPPFTIWDSAGVNARAYIRLSILFLSFNITFPFPFDRLGSPLLAISRYRCFETKLSSISKKGLEVPLNNCSTSLNVVELQETPRRFPRPRMRLGAIDVNLNMSVFPQGNVQRTTPRQLSGL